MEELRRNDVKMGLKLDQILEYNKRQDKLIGEIHKVVHGNGNPENGLIVKCTRMSEKIISLSRTAKVHWGLFVLLIGIAVRSVFF